MQFLIKHSSNYIMNLKNQTNSGSGATPRFRAEGDGEKALEGVSSATCRARESTGSRRTRSELSLLPPSPAEPGAPSPRRPQLRSSRGPEERFRASSS